MAEMRQDRFAAVLQEWKDIEQRQVSVHGLAVKKSRPVLREKVRFLERAEAMLEKPRNIEERLSLKMIQAQRRAAELTLFPRKTNSPALNFLFSVVRLARTLSRAVRYTNLRIDGLEAQRVAAVEMDNRMGAVRGSFQAAGMPSMSTKLQQQHEAGITPESLERRQLIGGDKLLHARYTIGRDAHGLPQVTEYTVQRKTVAGIPEIKHRFDAREVGILSDAVMANALEGRPFMAKNDRGYAQWYMVTDKATQLLEPIVDLTAALKQLPIKTGNPEKFAQLRQQLEQGHVVEATQRGGGRVTIRLGHDLLPIIEPAKGQAKTTNQSQEQAAGKGASKQATELRQEVQRMTAALRAGGSQTTKGVEPAHSL